SSVDPRSRSSGGRVPLLWCRSPSRLRVSTTMGGKFVTAAPLSCSAGAALLPLGAGAGGVKNLGPNKAPAAVVPAASTTRARTKTIRPLFFSTLTSPLDSWSSIIQPENSVSSLVTSEDGEPLQSEYHLAVDVDELLEHVIGSRDRPRVGGKRPLVLNQAHELFRQ